MENTEIAKKKNDINAVIPLIRLLRNFFESKACNILEVTFLEEFPPTDMILPVEKFSPKQIIENMIKKHRLTVQNVWKNPKELETIAFNYKIDAKPDKIEFTNNMEFYVDLQIISYYYFRILKYDLQNKPMQNIMKIMIKKYGISTEVQTENLDPATITFQRIVHSFPSVTLDMFYHDFGAYSLFLRALFSDFKLPHAIYAPVIVPVLPKLNDPPIAMLTAIALKVSDICRVHTSKIPLATIYQRVTMTYTSIVFPERLKLQLCKRWDIVMIKENEYHFHPSFKVFRNKAKELISRNRLDDPDLENILSRV